MFYGFNTAVSGLLASQRGLYTTNHNMTNYSTPGYSRQLNEQSATSARRLPGIGYLGTGTEITNIVRARDSFVDTKYWHEMAPLGEWTNKAAASKEIQTIIGEPSEHSFRQYMDDFYDSIDEMSKKPGDVSFRQPVKENALSFTKHVNEVAKKLQNMKKETSENIQIKVDEMNSLADQVVKLNRQIFMQEIDGRHANDLRDKREFLVDEMSSIMDVSVTESADGHYDISIGGTSLVNHDYANKIVYKRPDQNDPDSKHRIQWDNGSEVKFKSGEVKGLMDVLIGDGKNNTYRGIPFYEDQLNHFAQGYAERFNEQHKKGYTQDGEPGKDFFVFDKDGNAAATITVSQHILDDVRNIAAAGNPEGGNSDNENLKALVEQREDRNFFEGKDGFPGGTPDDFIKSMMSSMAVDGLQTERFVETQKLMQQNISNKRQSISGVNMNEEMANLVKFQHVYKSSSAMINTLDSLLDLTVNRLGMVGR